MSQSRTRFASNPSSPITEHPAFSSWNLEPARSIPARHSHIVEYRGRDTGRTVIVKSITESYSVEHAARVAGREYAAISDLSRQLCTGMRDTIPQPLLWLPGTPAFAMTKLDGVPLGTLARRQAAVLTFWGWRPIVETARRIGEWLRGFHEATRRSTVPFEPGPFLDDMDRHVRRSITNGWPDAAAEGVTRRAIRAGERTAGHMVPLAARQGDFSVQNILLDGTQVRVVDFENFAEIDAIYEDVCAFTSYLRLLSSSRLYARRVLRDMRLGFLDAYRASLGDPVFKLYELKLAVSVLSEFPASGSRWRQMRHRMLQQDIRAMAEAL